MSMFSMISSCEAPGFGDRLLERVEVHDDEVDGLAAEAREVRVVHRAAHRMPPWTRGCSVFTRPSMTSGEPV